MAMSQMMLGIEMHSCVRKRLMQVPSSHGFQSLSRGVHWKMAARMQAMFQAVEIPPQIHPPSRTERTGKMRK